MHGRGLTLKVECSRVRVQGDFLLLQREKEETKRQDGTGSEDTHVAGYVSDTTPIK